MPANWHVRCVSVPSPDTDLTLHVAFDNSRFIFGCGEGTQRAFTQKRLSLRGVEAVFLLNAQNRARAGLPGVLLTAADAGLSSLKVIGPPDTAHHVGTFRASVMRDRFNVRTVSYPLGTSHHTAREVLKTESFTVTAVALVPMGTPRLSLTEAERSAEPLDIDIWRPDFTSTRPSLLPRRELEAWRDLVVRHMFDRGDDQRHAGKPIHADAGAFQHPNGQFYASWPEHEYPLPLPLREEQITDMVYICHAPPVRGKFDVKIANELGVPNGPIRGRLVKGENIEVADPKSPGGVRIVRPEDCLKGGGPGAILMVVSCSRENLATLLDSQAFQPYQTSKGGDKHVAVIVHRVGRAVWRNEQFQDWLRAFGDKTQHLYADPEYYTSDEVFRSSAWNVSQLAVLDPQIFQPVFGAGESSLRRDSFEAYPMVQNTRPLIADHQVKMQPPGAVERLAPHEKDEPLPSKLMVSRDAFIRGRCNPEYLKACQVAAEIVAKQAPAAISGYKSYPGADITIDTLGTGSAIPSKHRNVSSTLLTIPDVVPGETGRILLDCGEGTLGQLRRRFGPSKLKQVWWELRMIYISHMHADHHLGLQSILEDRFRHGVFSPLYIVGPTNIALALQESAGWQYTANDSALANVFFIPAAALAKNQKHASEIENGIFVGTPPGKAPRFNDPPAEWGQEDILSGTRRWPFEDVIGFTPETTSRMWSNLQSMLRYLNLKWVQTPLVPHRGPANALVMKHASGWQIVYSGDTRPSQALIDAGSGATLLIHEATLADDAGEMAAAKGHSTFSEAVEVGRKMGAKHILLNHFSQRYPKMPRLAAPPVAKTDIATSAEPIVAVSFDFMSIKVKRMWQMAHYNEAISLLFEEDEGDDDDNTAQAVEHDVNASVEEVEDGGAVASLKSRGGQKGSDANGSNGSAAKRARALSPGKPLARAGHGRTKTPLKRKGVRGDTPPHIKRHGAKHGHPHTGANHSVTAKPAEQTQASETLPTPASAATVAAPDAGTDADVEMESEMSVDPDRPPNAAATSSDVEIMRDRLPRRQQSLGRGEETDSALGAPAIPYTDNGSIDMETKEPEAETYAPSGDVQAALDKLVGLGTSRSPPRASSSRPSAPAARTESHHTDTEDEFFVGMNSAQESNKLSNRIPTSKPASATSRVAQSDTSVISLPPPGEGQGQTELGVQHMRDRLARRREELQSREED